MRFIGKTIVGTALILSLASCGNGLNSDGLPTSLDSHVQLVCDANFKEVDKLPKQTKDEFWDKNSKSSLCSCTKDKMKNDPGFTFDGVRLNDDAALYKAFKKYKSNELDPMYKQGYQLWTGVINQAIRSCVKQ